MSGYNQFLVESGTGRQYVWARSDCLDGSFAYRMVFMLDANGMDTTAELLDGARRCWHDATGPSGWFDPCCTRTYRFPIGNGIVIDMNEADWVDAFRYSFR